MEHHHQLQSKRQKTHHDDDSRVHGFSTAIDPVDDFQYENSIQETNLIGSSSFLYPGNFHGQVEEYEQARIDENFVEIIESNREECPILSLDSGLEQQHQFSVMRDHFEAFVEIGQNMMKQLGATATGKAVMDRNQDSQFTSAHIHTNQEALLEELQKIKESLTASEKQLASAQKSLVESREELNSLRLQKDKDKDALIRQKQALEKIGLEKMLHRNPLTTSQGPDDDSIFGAKDALYWSIRSLAHSSFKCQPLRKPTKAAQKQAFLKVTRDQAQYEEFLCNTKLKPYIVESIIWDNVIDDLLYNPLQVYIGSQDIEIVMRLHLQASDKDYPSWRAGTACLVHSTAPTLHDDWKKDGSQRGVLVKRLVELLSRYHNTGRDDELSNTLETIVEKAIELAGLVARSRAYWILTMASVRAKPTVHNYDTGSRRSNFDIVEEFTMVTYFRETKKQGPLGKRKVDLIVRPLQLKWGDSLGSDYGVAKVMREREVIADFL